MKTLLFANQKGGVGKSALACQLAYYMADVLKLRTLVIDFDHQSHTTKPIRKSGLASVSDTTSSRLLEKPGATVEEGGFVLVPAHDSLVKLVEQGQNRNAYATNLKAFIASVASRFDVCIIDVNPNPDIRMVASLVVADFVLSPIELNQEAIDGIASLYSDVTNIKAALNPGLEFLGILPNKVVSTPFQKANFAELSQHFAHLLFTLPDGKMALIQQRTAIPEAQAEGKPLWKLGKTSARDAWREIEPTFNHVANRMGVR